MFWLAGCASGTGARSLEEALAPDPQLQASPAELAQPATSPTTAQLPPSFPQEIPRYPGATLQRVVPLSGESPASPGAAATSVPGFLTRWLTVDSKDKVLRFYQAQFQDSGWRLLPTSTDGATGTIGSTIVAQRGNLLVTVTLPETTAEQAAGNPAENGASSGGASTEFLIEYSQVPGTIAETPTSTLQLGGSASSTDGSASGLLPTPQVSMLPSPSPSGGSVASQPQQFSDLDKVPPALRQAVQDVAMLGVLQLQATGAKTSTTSSPLAFEPGKAVTRREYARWLVAANNRLYADRPAQQIRLATEASQPAFQDIPRTDPDFAAIQGLAEAGILPSLLLGQGSAQFRPNDPLTREQMLLWKVPLDTRQALPAANIEAIKQTWGFQDAAQIESRASRAVLADFQAGDLAIIRRVFGYTTLFQPKKAVTRAEAAASLWYFGSQTEGISAEQALEMG